MLRRCRRCTLQRADTARSEDAGTARSKEQVLRTPKMQILRALKMKRGVGSSSCIRDGEYFPRDDTACVFEGQLWWRVRSIPELTQIHPLSVFQLAGNDPGYIVRHR